MSSIVHRSWEKGQSHTDGKLENKIVSEVQWYTERQLLWQIHLFWNKTTVLTANTSGMQIKAFCVNSGWLYAISLRISSHHQFRNKKYTIKAPEGLRSWLFNEVGTTTTSACDPVGTVIDWNSSNNPVADAWECLEWWSWRHHTENAWTHWSAAD